MGETEDDIWVGIVMFLFAWVCYVISKPKKNQEKGVTKVDEKTSYYSLKNFFIWMFVIFIGWPILIFIVESILFIIYLIIGFALFFIFNLDITSEGTMEAEIVSRIFFPNGSISFYPLLPWRHFWIVFLLVTILFIVGKYKTSTRFKKFKEWKESKRSSSQKLYAKQMRRKTRAKSSKIQKQTTLDNKQKEIESFFESLKRKSKPSIMHYNYGAILDEANYNLFYSFINEAKESLDILSWRIDERLLSELLWFLKNNIIKVVVITKNRINKGYLNEFKKHCSNLKLELIHRNKIHAKLIVKDKKDLALGSSNFTEASMSESGHFLDCNIVTKHKETVQSAIDLFNSLYHNRDNTKKIQNSRLMYSRNHKDYLPFSLKPYFEQEKGEVVLLFPCNMVDKRIVDRIIEWNSTTSIKLYVGDSWATSGLSKDNLNSMKWLYEASINDYKNVSVMPIRKDVHAKLYLFKNQRKAFISSQNLTVESWQSLLETGIIVDDLKDFKYLYDSIKSLKKSQLTKIEIGDLEETAKPESTFSGSIIEKSIGIPWELPESDNKWKIPRTRNQSYYNLVKHKPKEKKEKLLEGVGKREGPDKVIKSPLQGELESKYLSKKSITGLYSKPTRYIITDQSKEKKKRDIESEIEYYKEKYKLASTEKEKKKCREAIEWKEKELEEFD